MDDVYEAEDGDAIPSDAYAPEDEDLPEDEFGGWSEASAEAVSLSKIAECTRITFDPLEEVFWAGNALVRETHNGHEDLNYLPALPYSCYHLTCSWPLSSEPILKECFDLCRGK